MPIQISDSLPDGIKRSMFPRTARFMSATAWMRHDAVRHHFRRTGGFSARITAKPTLRRVTVPPHGRASVWATPPLSTFQTAWFALYGNLGKKNSSRAFIGWKLPSAARLPRSLSRTLAVQTRELPAAEYAVAVPPAKKPSARRNAADCFPFVLK